MTAISLHIGLNKVLPSVYGSEMPLAGCINDAKAMKLIADSLGYQSSILTNEQATVLAVESAIMAISARLKPNDIFLLTYSGHGSQILDRDGDESDGLDETWCLFDGQIVDDDLYKLWGKFREGVRLVIVSDSCHSGTVARNSEKTAIEAIIGKDIGCKASGVLLSGCRDNQVSYDTLQNGMFTSALLDAWNGGKYRGSYSQFLRAISTRLGRAQTPNFFTFGKLDMKFLAQKPFVV